mgnify:CR=1 FL=1
MTEANIEYNYKIFIDKLFKIPYAGEVLFNYYKEFFNLNEDSIKKKFL